MFTVTIDLKKKFKKYFDEVNVKIESIISTLNAVLLRLDNITSRLITIERKEDEFMADVASDLEALRTALDTATNAVAAKIQALTSSITNSMTDAEVANVKAGLGAVVTRLNNLAADPTNPVPPETPSSPI